MFKIAFLQVFDIFNVNLRKNEGFLPCFPCNPIPEYGGIRSIERALSFLSVTSFAEV